MRRIDTPKVRGKPRPPGAGAKSVMRAMAEADAVEQNKALTDILRVISSSPADLQPVFDTILSHAIRLCEGDAAVLWQYDGSRLHFAAGSRAKPHKGATDPGTLYLRKNPLPLGKYNPTPQAGLERRTLHVADVFADRKYRPLIPKDSFGTIPNAGTVLAVPLLRQEELFGVVSIWRFEKRLFTDKQIAMMEAFAAQAVIAIHNVRLLNETNAALERQTATSEVLQVISASLNDVQPVFEAIAERAATLCRATFAFVGSFDGELIHMRAFHGAAAEAMETIRAGYPMKPGPGAANARAILKRATVQIPDVLADSEYAHKEAAQRAGWRSSIGVPMLRDKEVIGSLALARADLGPFPDEQVKLLETFAAQAVIAIENARLFNETKEALEQQTATAEVLKVISSSPTDVQPVFEAIAQSAMRLCDTYDVGVALVEGNSFRRVVHYGPIAMRPLSHVSALDDGSLIGRTALEARTMHVADAMQLDESEFPSALSTARRFGFRTALNVPLLRAGRAIGVIFLRRQEVRPFTDRQIALLEVFASQAVIAIENVRLFNETKESLEQQTAIGEVLRAISGSPTDVKPVLEAVAVRAARICEASDARIFLVDGEQIRHAAGFGNAPAPMDVSLDRGSVVGRAIIDRVPMHVDDVKSLSPDQFPISRKIQERIGHRTMLAVPLMREDRALGAILLRRMEVRSFTDKQVALLKTFADQAAIAIENVRLFNETKESLEQQTATAEILKVISSSPTATQPVFEAIVQCAARLFAPSNIAIVMREGEVLQRKARAGPGSTQVDQAKLASIYPLPLDPERSMVARSMIERRIIEITDTEAEGLPAIIKSLGKAAGYRAITLVPLIREGEGIGVIGLNRPEPGFKLTEKELALVKTFADQAVIAIENVRLFKELQTTNASLREALEQQTATGEILKVISSSATDVQPVFDTITRNAVRLGNAAFGFLISYDGEMMHLAASHNADAQAEAVYRPVFPRPAARDTFTGRAILDRAVVNLGEISESDFSEGSKERARQVGFRSVLVVPMLRGDVPIGVLAINKREPGAFSDAYVALLQTFADQAVIAIENVRLFNETKESLEQQTAISEVLRVISSSPADVQPVLDAVAVRAARICDAMDAHIFLVEDGGARHTAHFGDLPLGITKGQVRPLDRAWATGRAILDRVVVHIEDLAAAQEFPISQQIQAVSGARTGLAVPLMRENRALGAIVLRRTEVRAFSDKQLALLKTFADQAAIAIENVRLFNETKESLDQQKASADVLGVISSSIADTKPVFDKILESCERLFEGQNVGISVLGEDGLAHLAAYRGPHGDDLQKGFPIPVDSRSATGLAILERSVVHYPDTLGGGDVPEFLRRNCEKTGNRSIIVAPMLWEGRGIGGIFVSRQFAGAFSEKAIRQLRTFADQAAIAIQNARLFREIQEKSAQLEVANKHKSDFLANMSHELRTPLNAIIGFSEALMERMFGEVNDKQADYLKDIHESGRHLLSLINDILDLSKIEAGRMELDVSTFHLPTALSNAMTLIRERAQRHSIGLGLEVDQRLGEFQADERKFKQIMLNLLSNAVKFTPDGGRVDVCAKKDTDKIEIAVKDTGIGIAPEDQALVFEEFKQVGRDRMRQAEGTGLGLALTRRFVELHGGAIRLESTPGKGSTFTVSLPLRS
jgi:GAF domain-containing protein